MNNLSSPQSDTIPASFNPADCAGPIPAPPNPYQKGTMRLIAIEQLNRGYIVTVDCHRFAFSNKDEMVGALVLYINDPETIEKKWFAGTLFDTK